MAFFSKIYIHEDPDTREQSIRVDYNQPFDDLFSRLVPAHVHHDIQADRRTESKISRPEDRAGDAAFTVGVSEGQVCPPSTLVELRGIEPRSSSVDPGLLRVQSVGVVFSAPALDADTSPTGPAS